MKRFQSFVLGLLVVSGTAASTTGCADREITVDERPVKVVHETTGMGKPVEAGDYVIIDYRITTEDGREIQRFKDYGFQVGTGTVVIGMDEAIVGMREKGRRVVEVPPQKHWGRRGHGEGPNAIPPLARLTFDITLNEIR